jgi:hypothetical protein
VLGAKNAVRAAVACGHVYDPAGEFVANVDLELVTNGKTIAVARSDLQGDFMFGPVPTGEYDLTTQQEEWHLFWPVNITGSKLAKVCKRPLEVKLGIKTCGQSVWKKGYHAKF